MNTSSNSTKHTYWLPKDGRDVSILKDVGNRDWIEDRFFSVESSDPEDEKLTELNNILSTVQEHHMKADLTISLKIYEAEYSTTISMDKLYGKSWLIHELLKQTLARNSEEEF